MSGAGRDNHFLILNSNTTTRLSVHLSQLCSLTLRGRGISGFMDYRVLYSKHTNRKCTDIIYSSGHEVAGSWKIVQATHSQTQLELQLRTETKKMECWPQSCAVVVVSSISGGARGWSPESRGWAVWCRGQWRWRTCSPGATVYTGYTGYTVLAPCHGYTLLPTALSCQHPSGSHFSNVDFVLYEQKM